MYHLVVLPASKCATQSDAAIDYDKNVFSALLFRTHSLAQVSIKYIRIYLSIVGIVAESIALLGQKGGGVPCNIARGRPRRYGET